MWRANLYAAAAYVLAAYAGWFLSYPPGNISPVWPASGIALGALLLHGNALLPGVILGILWIKLESFIGLSDATAFAHSLPAALGAAAGSILQAGAGAALIRKFVGTHDPLIENHQIGLFLLLAGPVSCTIGATLGVLTLYATGILDAGALALTWVNWWGGDAIGAITFAPMVLILFAEPRVLWRWRIKSVLLPLLAVVTGIVLLFHHGYRQEWQDLEVEFTRQANLLQLNLEDDVQGAIDENKALKAFFDASASVTEEDFHIYASSLLVHATGVNALEWIPRVPHEARAAFEEDWRGAGSIREPAPGGTRGPAGERPEYFPVRYIVPGAGNEAALGFDVGTNPGAASALAAARDTGRVTATPPLTLVQDPEKIPGTVLYAPVYARDADWVTVGQRREHFLGVVATVFRVADRIAETRRATPDLLSMAVHDSGTPMYTDAPPAPMTGVNLQHHTSLEVAGRTWQLSYLPTQRLFEAYFLPNLWWLLLGSFTFTALAAVGLLMLTGQTLRTERLVEERTRELRAEAAQRKRMIEMRELQNQVLAQIAGLEPLQSVLESLVRMTEATHEGLVCSINLLDADRKRFSLVIAPSMPDEFRDALTRHDIGPGIGSCGTSAATGERVIVADVYTHPYWKDFTDLARHAAIRACWSEPIIADREILGSFAFYHRDARQPAAEDLEFIHDLAALAGIAIVRRRSETQIERLAFFDVLTDLPNRRMLLDRLEREIASASRHGRYGAVLYIDLDNFKTLNDSMGHFVGDLLLIQVADRLRACIRREDTAARLGGDEFVILLREEDPDMEKLSDRVMVLAQRVQRDLARPYDLNGYLHHISPSIGITFFSREVNSPDEVLKQADTAMYNAKARGRNTISFYHPDMQKHVDERLMLERDLRIALEKREFRLVFQPQYDRERNIIGAEALIRWQHPLRGVIPPDTFIPVAEENRMIVAIGEWVIAEACARLAGWPGLRHVSVNISPVQLRSAEFVASVRRILEANPHCRGRLTLEVTESIMIGDVAATAAILRELRSMGMAISIDDFGKGYSSLAYLKILPLDQLKIDKSFVNDLSGDSSDNVIVETIIAMAQHLKLDVIAEGVETQMQLDYLLQHGCNGFQGYFFSRPVEAEAFTGLLATAR